MNLKSIRTAWRTANDFGLRWTMRRLYYEFQLRTGHHKRQLPKRVWYEDEIQHWLDQPRPSNELLDQWRAKKPQFFFSIDKKAEMAAAIRQLNPNLSVEVDIYHPSYFSRKNYKVSLPEIWFTNPFLEPNVKCAPDLHWSEYPMYSPEYEDLKFIWEYGRFAIVYDLVRAYVLTGNEDLAEQYWTIVTSWIEHNPPNTGPHWKCGQETSLRLMAWYVGLFAFIDSPATTPDRFALFLGAVAAQAERISADWQYSYLQQSNHAVSEGLGLYITGVLFPQLKQAESWRKTGKFILEERSTFLFRADGTYFQKSHNYLRFIIHAYLYVIRGAEVNEDDFSDVVKNRMKAALTYLQAVTDEKSGFTPNFGSNDGALILPFNSCDFRDYRPTIAALHYYFHQERIFENGPWYEDLIWLFGPDAVKAPKAQVELPLSSRFDESGIYTLRSQQSWGFTHAESFTDRPAHADALHLDLWWRGINICCDPGTYLYYGHAPWLDAFKHTGFHNTLTIDDKDQMERAYRFTWGYWHDAKVNDFQSTDSFQLLEAAHNGYHRLSDPVTHKRAIVAIDDYWLVIDDVLGKVNHQLTINWLMADFPFRKEEHKILLTTPEGVFKAGVYDLGNGHETPMMSPMPMDIKRGNLQEGTRGLCAYYYGDISPAISIRTPYNGQLPRRFITCLGAQGWSINMEDSTLQLNTPEKTITLELNDPGTGTIIKNLNHNNAH